MLMNRTETGLVNSPPRRWLQRTYEVPVLLRFGGRLLPGTRALEIGCGSGYGSQLIFVIFVLARFSLLRQSVVESRQLFLDKNLKPLVSFIP